MAVLRFVVSLSVCFLVMVTFYSSCCLANSKGDFEKKFVYAEKGTRFYTAYNIYADGSTVYDLNFQVGDIVPVGSEVKNIRIETYDFTSSKSGELYLTFKTLSDEKTYAIDFTSRYHPGVDIYEFALRMFDDKPFETLSRGIKEDVLDAISRGAIVRGMTKSEVIISYGYPPEHQTPSLKSEEWFYWINRFKKKKVCFDADEMAISCEELEAIKNKRTSKDL